MNLWRNDFDTSMKMKDLYICTIELEEEILKFKHGHE